MIISTRGRYALRMMLDLAEHQGNGYVALKDIAGRQDISKKYLEQIIPVLNRAGFLQTVRGYQGGYRLVKAAEQYSLGGDPPGNGRRHGPGALPGGQPQSLPPAGRLCHASRLGRAGAGNQRLFRQNQPPKPFGPAEPLPGRRLCNLTGKSLEKNGPD